ncbi:hypothetical protein LTR37_002479 [Vermiconidia calcicola]|uniref:Uncharacterized protein n=1 Tax=Vermiconidia calcicola TaxID=1690605 RepID=A0ACC3NT47_9PEZI|nr:hypothetical protein LTR37_002479 [Vermiconidia calcicola]
MAMDQRTAREQSPLRIFIMDSPRLRSHLFFRFLSTSSQLAPIYHPFMIAAMFGPEEVWQHMKDQSFRKINLGEECKPVYDDATFENSQEAFVEAVGAAEKEGKVVLSNEHWFNLLKTDVFVDLVRGNVPEPAGLPKNPTHIPNDIFETLTPIFMIRHPVIAVRSLWRDAQWFSKQLPGEDDFDVIVLNKYQRLLFDFFKAQGRTAIVVDGEDILWRTQDMVKGLCAALGGGIDPAGFSETWDPTSKEELERMHPVIATLTKDIQESRGIGRPDVKPGEPSLDAQVQKWSDEHGASIADQLRGLVLENMSHYEYLKQFAV